MSSNNRFDAELASENIESHGYVLLAVIILVALSAFIVASSLGLASNTTRTVFASEQRSSSYFDAEQRLNQAASWLRANSTSLALVFSRNNFYETFDRSDPSVGSNDSGHYPVPTKVKLQGAAQSAMLSNDPALSVTNFPNAIIDTMTGDPFDPAASFAALDFGTDKLRITLVDAVAIDPAKDFGDPDAGNPAPETDFNPVYRVDAMDGLDMGGYVYGYLQGALVYDFGIGFYGKDYLEFIQPCDSYLSNSGVYNNANKRANCTAGSDGLVQIHQAEALYGSLKTKGSIDKTAPYGGPVCSDFALGCPNKGQVCEGPTCSVSPLPTYSPWNVYCPVNQGDIVVLANATILVPGDAPAQKCWGNVRVNSNKTLTLKTTNYAYFIDTLDISNTGRINFAPNPGSGTINLYVRKFIGDKFNGNQVFNINNKPYQLRLHYLGTDDLMLNGTADINGFVIAPYANVTVQGNFVYQGGIKALGLEFTGSGDVHYDESGDITTISDVSYRIRNLTQRYR